MRRICPLNTGISEHKVSANLSPNTFETKKCPTGIHYDFRNKNCPPRPTPRYKMSAIIKARTFETKKCPTSTHPPLSKQECPPGTQSKSSIRVMRHICPLNTGLLSKYHVSDILSPYTFKTRKCPTGYRSQLVTVNVRQVFHLNF